MIANKNLVRQCLRFNRTLHPTHLIVRTDVQLSTDHTIRFFSGDSDRIHSTDIAFKPAESGWGANSKYSSNFDNIFGKKKHSQTASTNEKETKDNSSNENDEESN